MKKFWKIIIYAVIIPFIVSTAVFYANMFGLDAELDIIVFPVITGLLYLIFRKKVDFSVARVVNGISFLIILTLFTLLLVISKGNVEGSLITEASKWIIPVVPVAFIGALYGDATIAFGALAVSYLATYIISSVFSHTRFRKIIVPAIYTAACIIISLTQYVNRPSVKYGGHGFDYMNGFSSTDFSDYMVYSENSKLATLDHTASLIIEDKDNMPVLDGAEACYPLYAAFAKAVYKNIDKIELEEAGKDNYTFYNGKIVTFTNTIYGFDRLLYPDENDVIDMFFGARPSASQLEDAKNAGIELEIIPIGKEGFVFFVENDNPVNNISSDDLRKIYSGSITNWSDAGGIKQNIIAFQRPENSGSQTMMKWFMGDVALKKPETYEIANPMGGVITNVAQYANEDGAIGYTFRYFLEELNQEKGVKILSVDGVKPSVENIESGEYPLAVDLCLIIRKNDDNPYIELMKDFILSEDGQEIIRKTGYAPLKG